MVGRLNAFVKDFRTSVGPFKSLANTGTWVGVIVIVLIRWMTGVIIDHGVWLAVGVFLGGVLAWKAGASWLRTRSPRLVVADRLGEDVKAKVYWLRVGVEGEGFGEPSAFVQEVVDEALHPLVPTLRHGIDLIPSHNQPGDIVRVAAGIPQSFGVVSAVDGMLRIHGRKHDPPIETRMADGAARKIYIKIVVRDLSKEAAAKRTISRWFSFEPDSTSPMFHRCCPSEPRWTGKVIWRVGGFRVVKVNSDVSRSAVGSQ